MSVSVSVSHGEESASGESSLSRGGLELVRFLGMRRSLEQSQSCEYKSCCSVAEAASGGRGGIDEGEGSGEWWPT